MIAAMCESVADDRRRKVPENDDTELPAGDFSVWLVGLQAALRGERDSDVPCGECTGCCTSAQFVHIGPEEIDTLAHIPKALLFAAPRLPRGHRLMGYDERGHCPMLVDNACSIYEHRPRTCRTYDCRVFVAAGVEVDDEEKAVIGQRARRWRFSYEGEQDRACHEAVRAAARFLRERASELTAELAPRTTTQLAVAAVEVHKVFLSDGDTNAGPDLAEVEAALSRTRSLSARFGR